MQTIQLQAIGHVPAKPARDFQIGEFMVWNFGHTSKVTDVLAETASFITFQIETADGKRWERRLKKDRLVGVAA